MDAVERRAWDKLGEPEDGESLKQVGKDPAREYQAPWKSYESYGTEVLIISMTQRGHINVYELVLGSFIRT